MWQQEASFELVDMPKSAKPWIQATYELALVPLGQKPEHVERVTVLARFLDAQSTGAVRSYARKYWLLGKFSLATGDVDSDHADTPGEAPAERPKPDRQPKPPAEQKAAREPSAKARELAERVSAMPPQMQVASRTRLKNLYGTDDPLRMTQKQANEVLTAMGGSS